MGKVRIKTIGIDELESEQKRKSKARREGKKAQLRKKQQAESPVEPIADTDRAKADSKPLAKPSKKAESPDTPAADVDSEAKAEKKSKAKHKKKVRSKRYQDALIQVDRAKLYPITDALALIKKTSLSRFDGTVETHIVLDPTALKEKGTKTKDKKSKPSLRGTVSFPHGTGKQVRVAIADDTLIAQVEKGKIDFDMLVSAPEMMPKLAKVAKVLGPKGLMPSPKNGTIGPDPAKIAEKMSKGQVSFKTEPENPIIHIAIGKVSFEEEKLLENLKALTREIGIPKIIRMTLSATMGPGIKVNPASL